MDKMRTNNSHESSSSQSENVSRLNILAEQPLQMTNQMLTNGGTRPRRFFCDDVLLDALHFLQSKEHAPIRLTNRRLQWLSDKACARYPPRVVPSLEVRGVYSVPRAEAASPRMIGNFMRVCPRSGDPYSVDFPSVEPPEDIVRLSELMIFDFVGPELLQFLRLSTRLMGNCFLAFNDFDNFVRHHSADFIARFLALFPSGHNRRLISLRRLSALAVPLFTDHQTLFACTGLFVECLDTFPLDALLGWLHLDEQIPLEQQKERCLFIRLFGDENQLGHSVASVDHFYQKLKQRFLSAASCCPFTVRIRLIEGPRPRLPALDPFIEENERTGELLEFRRDRDHHGLYMMKRRRRESVAGQEEGDRRGAETTKATMVHIGQVVRGDKQVVDPEVES